MAQYYGAPPNSNPAYGPSSAQNLQFYPSSYSPGVPGHGTPAQGSYGYGGPGSAGGYGASSGFSGGFGGASGVSGRMGEQMGLRTGWLAAFSTEGYDGEPPLLEELGVNFGHIQAKTLAVLNPFRRIDQHLMDDSDLAGPILFFILFGTFLLLSGQLHFGYIYGLALLGSISLYFIFALMTPDESAASPADAGPYSATPAYPGGSDPTVVAGGPGGAAGGGVGSGGAGGGVGVGVGVGGHKLSSTLTFTRSASVLGYCLLPLVATSAVGIVMPMDTPLGISATTAAIMWCTYSASAIFCAVGRMRGMRLLVAYPLALFYVSFGIMGVFSSRGSGSMAKVMAGGKGSS